jgi:lysophospholipase L1-like esterase
MLTRRRKVVLAGVLMTLSLAFSVGVIVLVDVYLHTRTERSAGFNVWGYRGPARESKGPSEHRVVAVGGSTTLGYGVRWEDAYPAKLEAALAKMGARVSVVNLGYNGVGVHGFRGALEDYLALEYDAAILYEGYNDLGPAPNRFDGRRESPIYRLIGYYPVLPLYLREKAMSIRAGGDLNAAYNNTVVFKPDSTSRSAASALEEAARIGDALARQLDRFAQSPSTQLPDAEDVLSRLGCPPEWSFHCAEVHDAVQFALQHDKKVLVVTQPYLRDQHRAQQAALEGMIEREFNGNASVLYVNLGDAIDLSDPALQIDGMHLSPAGNSVIADRLVEPVLALMPGILREVP